MKTKNRPKHKRNLIRGLLILCGVILTILGVGYVRFPEAELPEMVSEDVCSQYHITFDATSIETIYLHPESILADPEQFLQRDPAFQMMAQHRARVNDPFSYQAWLKDIEKLAAQPEESRLQRAPYRLYEQIMTYQQSFCQEVAENVLTSLPEGTELDVTVYLTAHEGSAAAYSSKGKVTFSLSHPLVENTALVHETTGLSAFFNLALHEFFHIGFYNSSEPPSEAELLENEIVVDVLHVLQNEGMATYLSHKLAPEFPTPFEWFIYMLDRETVVHFYLNRINDILLEGSPAPPLGEEYNQLYRRIARVGYRWNGLYIVGGYMAMTIESELGHEALVQTIEDGFYSFAETYNSLVDEDMQVRWNKVP
ncbi:MAG: DUF5700 domain-containing putative Zn-dependent protease [Anaerolineales bacterium]